MNRIDRNLFSPCAYGFIADYVPFRWKYRDAASALARLYLHKIANGRVPQSLP
jgi:hypothetical protein